MRLFIAVDLPDKLKRELGWLRTDIQGVRWVPPEQLHLTLAFLGEVDEETTERVIAQLAKIETDAFKLFCSELGCFPDRSRPRVIWVGVKSEPNLLQLAASVRQSIFVAGIFIEDRPFSPHITLARLKLPAAVELGAFLEQQSRLTLKPISVQEFSLFQSRLTSQGAVHSMIRSFPLTARASTLEAAEFFKTLQNS